MAFNSQTNLKVVDLISEGPIEGLVEGRGSLFLDETRVTDGQVTKREILYDERKGGQDQAPFSGKTFIGGASTSIVAVNQQVGSSYSEEVNADGEVTSRDYGRGVLLRTITDNEVTSVQLVFSIPRLFCTGVEGIARGQLFPAKIKFRVSIRSKGTAFNDITIVSEGQLQEEGILDNNVFTGISTNGYQFKSQPIRVRNRPGALPGPITIRVSKLEFEGDKEKAFEIRKDQLRDLPENHSFQSGRADVFIWDYIIQIKDVNLNYRHSACVALSISSEQFNSLPARAYDVKGKLVKIPSNATVASDGSLDFDSGFAFDGQLRTGRFWTTCPVCCFYDMVTNPRYGAGDFISASNISWIDLIDIAKYCNEKIDRGDGVKEPRFALNTVISSQADAYSVIQDLASVFRGLVYWRADTVQLAADHGNLDGTAIDPVHVFTNSNVVGGGFNYGGSSLKTRSTRVVVRYSDPDNFYKPNYVIIEDRAALDKYGLQVREVVAFGCTSKTQAQRMGKWLMKSEETEGETVNFTVGLEGLNVLPGQIFAVSDAMRQAARLSGRITGATRKFVNTDSAITSPSGSDDQLTVVLPDGRVQTRAVESISDKKITVSSKFDEPPVDGSTFALTDSSVANQKFRCLSVSEGEGGTYAVIGVLHVDNIYSVVESEDSDLEFVDTTTFDEAPIAPKELKIDFLDINQNRNRFKRILISWQRGTDAGGLPDPRSAEFQVEYRVTNSGNWTKLFTTATSVTIDHRVTAGQRVYARVRSVGPEPRKLKSPILQVYKTAGAESVTETDEGQIIEVLPPDVEEVTLEPVGTTQVTLSWSTKADGQNLDEFLAVVRHSGKTDGTGEWYNSSLLRKVEARVDTVTLPLMEGEYFIKLESSSGLRSANAVSAVIDLPESLPRFNFETIQEGENNFPGQRDGVYYDSTFDGLVLDGDASFDDTVTDLDGFTDNIDSIFGTQRLSGTYYFAPILDFGAKFSPLFKRILDSVGIYRTNTFDDRKDLIDTWSDFDGDIADDTDVQLYLRSSNDAPEPDEVHTEDNDSLLMESGEKMLNTSNTTFGDWVRFENTNYVGRQFQFKAELTTEHVDQTPSIESLGAVAQLELRTDTSEIMNSGPSAKTVTFDYPFYADADTKTSVGITAYNMETGDYFDLEEPTDGTGFTVTFKNGSSIINRKFRFTAVGYGKRQT